MMPEPSPASFDEQLLDSISALAETGIHHAARGMASMIGQQVSVSCPKVRRVNLGDIPNLLGGPENEAVGIYLRAEGALAGQFMLIIPLDKAMPLVDLILGASPGTSAALGPMERSALAEMGNLTGTFFLNALASVTGLETRPTPPAVVVDMVGAILDILLMSWDGLSEQVLMIQAVFSRQEQSIEANFWVIPDRSTLSALQAEGSRGPRPARHPNGRE
jgi:chemotaxis protein CheC